MKTIGRIDIVDFPLLGLAQVPVKVDTGAYTSSIHCHKIKLMDGKLDCTFKINELEKKFIFDTFTTKVVKSSNGIKENRYRVQASIKIFDKNYLIFLTLTKRGEMKFPVLLGRQFLKKRFLVDVNLKNQSHLCSNN